MITVLIIMGVIALIMLASAVDCALNIEVTRYEAPILKENGNIKAVCISDLHGWNYGKENTKLLEIIAEQKPDVIIIAGDMITRIASERQLQRVTAFIKKLTDIAHVFYMTGNHEADYMAENGMELLDKFSETGAEVLYDSFTETEIAGTTMRIGGASGRYFDGSVRDNVTLKMLETIGKSDFPSIAIVHQPENIFRQEKRNSWTADLYISGHTHGGVWRIPGLCGVMSPAEGLFPKYDKGQFFVDGKMPMIINGGLSGYYFIPRVFNRPEICVINLTKKQNRL